MRRALTLLGVVGFGLVAFALGLIIAGSRSPQAEPTPAVSVVDEVRAELAGNYYRQVPASVLRQPTIRSMLAALKDPYTEYLDPLSYRLLQQETARSYSGIGLTVLPTKIGLEVTSTRSGPGQAAGIRRGDYIVAIDGASAIGVPFEQSVGRILGPEGSRVQLRCRRKGKTLEFQVVRRRLSAPLLRAKLLAVPGVGLVGHVRLAAFRAGSAQILRSELRRLERAGMSALVLDLRGNPGGLLDQAVSVASLFLDKGVVVSVRGLHQRGEVYEARRKGATRVQLVVLVDRLSASAAEVVAAALNDNGRATLVGENTYGKALVQTVTPLRNGAALKLTTARYLTPAGIDISRQGVRPDVLAVDDPRTPTDEAFAASLIELKPS